MIPRVKVSYRVPDLVRALFARERGGRDYRAELSRELSAYLGEKNVLLTPSGRGGLYFLLRSLPQPQTIVPAYTCTAVVEAALLAGKEVIFVETESGGLNADAREIARVLRPDAVLIATHQFGIPCEIETLAQLCRERGTFMIEDCAAALGTRIGDRFVGTFGDAAFYSFDSTKLINVPLKAGFLTVKDDDLFRRVCSTFEREIADMHTTHKLRLLALGGAYLLLEHPTLYGLYHRFALRKRFTAERSTTSSTPTEFYRFRMTQWQASVALPQVRRIEALITRRRELYGAFREAFRSAHGIEIPPEDTRRAWACIRFPILVRGDKLAFYRAANARGVDFAFSFTFIASPSDFARSHRIAGSVLDVPFYEKLTEREFERVVKVVSTIAPA